MNPIVKPEINVRGKRAPLIVGRDPDRSDTMAGRPFTGPSGSLIFGGLDTVAGTDVSGALALAGLKRRDVNITNRVLRQPWSGDFGRHSRRDLDEGLDALKALIKELNPSVIVACGAQAAYDLVPGWATLTDRNPGEYSGGYSIYEAKDVLDRRGFFWFNPLLGVDCPILVTLHPGACLYQTMPNRLMLDIDFMRLGAHLRGELPRRVWPTPTRIYTKRDMDPVWDSKLVSYDIETTWGGDKLLCIGLYTKEGQAFIAYDDAARCTEEWFRSDHPKLVQNGQFDRYYFDAKLGIPVGGRHEDTIVGHWACYPELAGKEDTGREDQRKKTSYTMTRKGLNFLASFHLDVPWWKTYTSDRAQMGQLCVNDVAATMWLWEIIEPEIDAMGVRRQYERQMATLPALIRIQKRGFLIDEKLRQERIATLTGRKDKLEAGAHNAALAFIQAHDLRYAEDGSEYWWYHAARCDCCGGPKRALHCDRCAGLPDTKKPTLVQWAWRASKGQRDLAALKKMKAAELVALLPPCAACGGTSKIDKWDLNIMSATQMTELLFNHLGVPKRCAVGGIPNATDETIQNALLWARGDSNE